MTAERLEELRALVLRIPACGDVCANEFQELIDALDAEYRARAHLAGLVRSEAAYHMVGPNKRLHDIADRLLAGDAPEPRPGVMTRELRRQWNEFLGGHWQSVLPFKAGRYPLRTQDHCDGGTGVVYLTLVGGRPTARAVSPWGGDWWSEPIPALPGVAR